MVNIKIFLFDDTFLSSQYPYDNFENSPELYIGKNRNGLSDILVSLQKLCIPKRYYGKDIYKVKLYLPTDDYNIQDNIEIGIGLVDCNYNTSRATWSDNFPIVDYSVVKCKKSNVYNNTYSIDITNFVKGIMQKDYHYYSIALMPRGSGELITFKSGKGDKRSFVIISYNEDDEFEDDYRFLEDSKSVEPKESWEYSFYHSTENIYDSSFLNNDKNNFDIIEDKECINEEDTWVKNEKSYGNYFVDAATPLIINNGEKITGILREGQKSTDKNRNAKDILIEENGVYFITASVAIAKGSSIANKYSFKILILGSKNEGCNLCGLTTSDYGSGVLTGSYVDSLKKGDKISIQNVSSVPVAIENGGEYGTAVRISLFKVSDNE